MNADDRIAKLRSDKDEAENLLAILTELHEMDGDDDTNSLNPESSLRYLRHYLDALAVIDDLVRQRDKQSIP